MTRKQIFIRIILFTILLLPLWMYLAWLLTPKKKLVAAIIDKTVLTSAGQEHASLAWVLNYNRYTKNKTKLYDVSGDYFGFFPKQDEKFRIKGLERFSDAQLDQLSNDADLVYLTDAYGIYRNEWYARRNVAERSGIIYGGMSMQDISLLTDMKAKHKLVLTEFNCIGSPTSDDIRARFEKLFALKWTGWTGRFFDSFDTSLNPELPKWLIRNYEAEHNGHWPFKKSGIAFVSNNDRVVILEDQMHVTQPVPRLVTTDAAAEHIGLPKDLHYPFWFDVINTDTTVNTITARFQLDLNDSGRHELSKNGIPFSFPAIQMHKGKDYQFYYFSADFCDNPISLNTSYFKGIGMFKYLFYSRVDPADRAGFFWRYYRPLLNNILNEYYAEKP